MTSKIPPSALARAFFLFTLALVTIRGVISGTNGEYLPTVVTNPVLFHTIDVENSENRGKSEDIYCLAGDDLPLPSISADGAALLSASTGELIYGKSSDVLLPMASTTKIMTALTVLESGLPLSDVVTIPREAVGVEGSSIYLFEGEKITVRDLLYGLLLESGNDAATALAIATSGSESAFVELMNEKARSLGLTRTAFKNPHGLSAEGHATTAYELGLITVAALKNETFSEIVATKSYNTTPVSEAYPSHYFVNHNRLLRMLPGANGVKTGYTLASGRCLVSSACRDGDTYIAVTLGCRNDWKAHTEMLEFAFARYRHVTLAEKSALTFTLDGTDFTNPTPLSVLVRRDSEEKVSLEAVME